MKGVSGPQRWNTAVIGVATLILLHQQTSHLYQIPNTKTPTCKKLLERAHCIP